MPTHKKKRMKKKKKKKSKKKTCFVIGAIGDPHSDTRKRADSVLKEIIQPALNMRWISYKAERIDNKGGAGDITEGIIDMLRIADLVVVDLTYQNPNVMCELGIRQAWNLPIIPIITSEELKGLPFDLRVVNTVPYSLKTKTSKKEAIVLIRKQLRSILRSEQKTTVFSNAISLVGKRFSMDIVYASFGDALTDTDHSLFGFQHALAQTLDLGDEKTLEHFATSIRRVFESLSDKLYVFQQIARGRPDEYTDMLLLSLVDRVGKVFPIANKIDKLLMSRKPISVKKANIDKLLDSAIQTIGRVAKIIANRKNLIS